MELILTSPKYGEKTVFIDDEDSELISKYHWNISYVRGNWYVVSHVKGKQIKMHRLVMNETDPLVKIDHKNHCGLDNRKDNLRRASNAENTRNVGPTKNNKTGYKGVYLYKSNSPNMKYCVRIRNNGEKVFGGYFRTTIEAAEKYNELALRYHGEFAYLNTINDEELLKAKSIAKKKKNREPKNKEKLKTGYHGVTLAKDRVNKPYRAQIRIKNETIFLGMFKTAIDAAMSYNNALIEKGGNLNYLNTIPNE
jgi:hypothetical protein